MTRRVHRSGVAARGMALVTALVFVVVLAMLGVWAMANNSLEQRMAGNTGDRDLAFQAGEAALRYAEATLTSWRGDPFDGTNGLLAYDPLAANDRAHWMAQTSWPSFRTLPLGALNQVSASPRIVIQRMPNTPNPANPSQADVENYRITVRASGADPNTVVILQTIVQYTP